MTEPIPGQRAAQRTVAAVGGIGGVGENGFIADGRTRLLDTLDAGFSLPSDWYADPALFALETRQLLRRSWHYAAHDGEIPAPGDQIPGTIAGVPIVLVRGVDGEVHGFVNICRHRAHLVVLEPRNRKALTCSYHGWTYDLDGRLKHAPRADAETELDRSACSLARVQVARWGPTIWVNVDLDAPSFDQWIAGLPELVASRGVDLERHAFAVERSWEIRANWKVFMDNAIECYHCPTAHPELSRALEMDPDLQESLVGGRNWIAHSIPFRRSGAAAANGGEGTEPARAVYHFHWIFPTTYLQYAGAGFDIGTVRALDVDRISFQHLAFAPVDAGPDDIERLRLQLREDPTILQDVGICERVQTAHASGAAQPGRLLPRSEMFVQHFQRVVAETLTAEWSSSRIGETNTPRRPGSPAPGSPALDRTRCPTAGLACD
ncbi:MAG: aromatic ring-hydroxylating oxygenase subunit alpha [Acidimicrobiia bacterium]